MGDLVAVRSDAKSWNDYHQKLTDHYENRMECTERLEPIAVDSLNECIQENQQVKTATEVNSARSRKIVNILREICIDNPFEAREVFSEDDVMKQYVEATQDEIQSLKLRVDNLDNIMRLRFDSVRQEMVQEYHIEDCKVTSMIVLLHQGRQPQPPRQLLNSVSKSTAA